MLYSYAESIKLIWWTSYHEWLVIVASNKHAKIIITRILDILFRSLYFYGLGLVALSFRVKPCTPSDQI
jgi:hypothetical protein